MNFAKHFSASIYLPNFPNEGDYFLAGMIRALEIVQEVRAEGDNLNNIQWQEVIEMRRRDMYDASKLEHFIALDSQKINPSAKTAFDKLGRNI